MSGWLALCLLLAAPLRAGAVEVPPELRGRISVEVTSCEPLRADAPARAVLLRVRAGASALRQPEIRCGAFVPGTDQVLGWTRVAGLEQLAAESARAVMTLVPADAAHSECRCVADVAAQAAVCAPWESLENGSCVEPGERAAAPARTDAAADDVTAALGVSRALAALRRPLERSEGAATSAGLCAAVEPAQLKPLVAALVPEDGTVYVTPLWRLLDATDQRVFARWSDECFGVTRLVDAERGVELSLASQPARER